MLGGIDSESNFNSPIFDLREDWKQEYQSWQGQYCYLRAYKNEWVSKQVTQQAKERSRAKEYGEASEELNVKIAKVVDALNNGQKVDDSHQTVH